MEPRRHTPENIRIAKTFSLIFFIWIIVLNLIPNFHPLVWAFKILWISGCIGCYISLRLTVKIQSWVDLSLILAGPIALTLMGIASLRYLLSGPPKQ